MRITWGLKIGVLGPLPDVQRVGVASCLFGGPLEPLRGLLPSGPHAPFPPLPFPSPVPSPRLTSETAGVSEEGISALAWGLSGAMRRCPTFPREAAGRKGSCW